MNYSALLQRAFNITKRFRVLWLFGILVALTGGGTSSGSSGLQYRFDESDLQRTNWPDWLQVPQWGRQAVEWMEQFDPSRYVGLFIACCCLLAIFAIVAVIVQYVARARRSSAAWTGSRPPAVRRPGAKASAWAGATGRSASFCWS